MDKTGRKHLPLGPVSPSSVPSGTSNVIENSQSYLTPSQRRLSFVNLNGNHDPFVSHTTSQITQNKHGVASNSSGCANISGNGQDYLTPSQRRLRSVNLSGITTSGPVSRAIQRKPTTTTNVTPF
ncbi:hypothetical protein POM88_006672 [Heracleum sosnowskyi]|uniref:Uncharacterized protein n=1 Tax=Heracleum sosnowskyi TaxID=360622 RepID=A0AAD8J4P7_9APIA|nr:hypothetical protein POM88_006672 [Heracleum sosnowskyi]